MKGTAACFWVPQTDSCAHQSGGLARETDHSAEAEGRNPSQHKKKTEDLSSTVCASRQKCGRLCGELPCGFETKAVRPMSDFASIRVLIAGILRRQAGSHRAARRYWNLLPP